MRVRTRSALLALAIGLVVVVVGCSSGGVGGPDTEGADATSGQSAAGIFVQQWAQTLWGLVANQTGNQAPTFGQPTPNPDGSISVTFTGADGTEAKLTQFPDGTARLELVYSDGSTQTVDQSKPSFDGVSKTTIDWSVRTTSVRTSGLPAGTALQVDYTSVVDDKNTIFDISDDTTTLQGQSLLPSGVTQQFDVLTDAGSTRVASTQSDGSTFEMDVPLRQPDFLIPDFTQAATGAYRSPDFDIEITLESTVPAPSRWASLASDLGGGLTGQFALEPDFAGSGRLNDQGQLLAVLSWTADGETQVQFVSASQGATSPAGAAIDYLIHRWQTLAALLAPSAGTSSAELTAVLGRGGSIDVAGL